MLSTAMIPSALLSPTGIPLTEITTAEGSDPDYIANEGQSCFHCKTHLYSALEAVAAQAGVESRRGLTPPVDRTQAADGAVVQDKGTGAKPVVLFNGTNKDDKRDPTRSDKYAFGVSSMPSFIGTRKLTWDI